MRFLTSTVFIGLVLIAVEALYVPIANNVQNGTLQENTTDSTIQSNTTDTIDLGKTTAQWSDTTMLVDDTSNLQDSSITENSLTMISPAEPSPKENLIKGKMNSLKRKNKNYRMPKMVNPLIDYVSTHTTDVMPENMMFNSQKEDIGIIEENATDTKPTDLEEKIGTTVSSKISVAMSEASLHSNTQKPGVISKLDLQNISTSNIDTSSIPQSKNISISNSETTETSRVLIGSPSETTNDSSSKSSVKAIASTTVSNTPSPSVDTPTVSANANSTAKVSLTVYKTSSSPTHEIHQKSGVDVTSATASKINSTVPALDGGALANSSSVSNVSVTLPKTSSSPTTESSLKLSGKTDVVFISTTASIAPATNVGEPTESVNASSVSDVSLTNSKTSSSPTTKSSQKSGIETASATSSKTAFTAPALNAETSADSNSVVKVSPTGSKPSSAPITENSWNSVIASDMTSTTQSSNMGTPVLSANASSVSNLSLSGSRTSNSPTNETSPTSSVKADAEIPFNASTSNEGIPKSSSNANSISDVSITHSKMSSSPTAESNQTSGIEMASANSSKMASVAPGENGGAPASSSNADSVAGVSLTSSKTSSSPATESNKKTGIETASPALSTMGYTAPSSNVGAPVVSTNASNFSNISQSGSRTSTSSTTESSLKTNVQAGVNISSVSASTTPASNAGNPIVSANVNDVINVSLAGSKSSTSQTTKCCQKTGDEIASATLSKTASAVPASNEDTPTAFANADSFSKVSISESKKPGSITAENSLKSSVIESKKTSTAPLPKPGASAVSVIDRIISEVSLSKSMSSSSPTTESRQKYGVEVASSIPSTTASTGSKISPSGSEIPRLNTVTNDRLTSSDVMNFIVFTDASDVSKFDVDQKLKSKDRINGSKPIPSGIKTQDGNKSLELVTSKSTSSAFSSKLTTGNTDGVSSSFSDSKQLTKVDVSLKQIDNDEEDDFDLDDALDKHELDSKNDEDDNDNDEDDDDDDDKKRLDDEDIDDVQDNDDEEDEDDNQ